MNTATSSGTAGGDIQESQGHPLAPAWLDDVKLGQLLAGDEVLHALINAGSEAIVGVDAHGRIVIFNFRAADIFGTSAARMCGQDLRVLLPERLRDVHQHQLQPLSQAPDAEARLMQPRQVRGLRSDGREVELECFLSRVVIHQQLVLVASLRDVTERSLADARLRSAQAQLRALTAKLMTQEETLVTSLAQVLHDELGQTIAAIRLAPEVAPLRWPHDVEMAAFMVAREAVDNAFCHAQATKLAVRIEGSDLMLRLSVIDNGVGIAADAGPRDTRLGVLGMRERSMAAGATLTLEPAQPQGTQVCFHWQGAA